MREVDVLEAKTRFSELLDAVEEQGEVITITRRGKAVAMLHRVQPVRRQLSGEELLEKARQLRERYRQENPGAATETWEEIKDMASDADRA